MKIRITVGATALTATLEDNAAAADFALQLPLTTTLEDYASTEKIAYLPGKLTTAGAPPGMSPSVADIAYYAPWGNLAVFHRDARHADGLVKLGRIDSGIEAFQVRGPLRVTIERMEG